MKVTLVPAQANDTTASHTDPVYLIRGPVVGGREYYYLTRAVDKFYVPPINEQVEGTQYMGTYFDDQAIGRATIAVELSVISIMANPIPTAQADDD